MEPHTEEEERSRSSREKEKTEHRVTWRAHAAQLGEQRAPAGVPQRAAEDGRRVVEVVQAGVRHGVAVGDHLCEVTNGVIKA